MITYIDNLLNRFTMYRVVLYELIALLLVALGLGFVGSISYSPLSITYSLAFIFVVALAANTVFAWAFDAPANPDSTYITALILTLLITPPSGLFDPAYLSLATWATTTAIASKYIFAWRKKHIFNPAAFGIAATAFFLGQATTWWVGTAVLLPAVAIGGLLVVRKIRRFDLFLAGTVTATVVALLPTVFHGGDIFLKLHAIYFDTALVFFASIMLTEPLTTPPNRTLRIFYGTLVGMLFVPNIHIGSFYFTPEFALLVGNIFSFIVSPKEKLVLKLIERIPLAKNTYEFVFKPNQRLAFTAGEYMEWTLPHPKYDTRGIRRYFTIASAPSDPHIRLGVKFYDKSSTFKKALLSLPRGAVMTATGRAGEFTLPENHEKKIAAIAGGIGITPFASMLSEMLVLEDARDMVLLYSNRTPADVAYSGLIEAARERLGIHTYYAFSDEAPTPPSEYQMDAITPESLVQAIPDYRDRIFYLSGPQAMVTNYKKMLLDIGVHRRNIRTDFFPGFA